ncbi:aromatic-ring-hydroxylating dioxygenase subunit beta [Capillimicrobium parvum]|uniref:Biphenyl dioxygenase subunit beta n=1 Tax=Capillimicrobium parvum TaxID=2884022 RepID=A0A9E6Y275_9ACTN|nr:aromatic-ring-hydroxylating dioxygenase subunit beta [Capillimicrobium parvum]UGS38228.1 Biphenyl dioxygenase subunit beta [Capillimicrobium parvum]
MSADQHLVPPLADLQFEREATAFLHHEAQLQDERAFEAWLQLLDPEIRYRVPVRVTMPEGQGPEHSEVMFHFDETRQTLGMRVARLYSGDAWAEVPPSRTRHFVSNVRVTADGGPDRLLVRSNLLFVRIRGDEVQSQSLTAERRDVLRHDGGAWRLLDRLVLLDATTLPTYNLAFFL